MHTYTHNPQNIHALARTWCCRAGYGYVTKLRTASPDMELVAKQVCPPAASGASHERKVIWNFIEGRCMLSMCVCTIYSSLQPSMNFLLASGALLCKWECFLQWAGSICGWVFNLRHRGALSFSISPIHLTLTSYIRLLPVWQTVGVVLRPAFALQLILVPAHGIKSHCSALRLKEVSYLALIACTWFSCPI